jgi:mannose-1-phosphate guanylyltransferase
MIDDIDDIEETAIKKLLKKHLRIHCNFGIVATKPETGYGYIERKGDDVISFREKTASFSPRLYKGNFLWNSGMFCLGWSFIGRIESFSS